MAAAIYSTSQNEGVDVNSVFILDPTGTPEYPAPPFTPGTPAYGTDGSEWVFVTASLSLAAGTVVLVSQVPGSWSVAPVGGATVAATLYYGCLVGVVGGSQGSMSITAPTGTQRGSYFWIQRAGNCPNVRCGQAVTANAQLFTTATLAGIVHSTGGGAATTNQISGIVISQRAGSLAGFNTGILNYPAIFTGA